MPPPTLHYAPAPTLPLRLRPLALGTALIFCSTAFSASPYIFLHYHPPAFSVDILNFLSLTVFALYGASILPAVFFFNIALPSLSPKPKPRLPFLVGVIIAATFLLVRFFYLVIYAIYPASIRSPSTPLTTTIMITVSYLDGTLQLALLTAAARFFYVTASRLNHRPLGIFAAAAFTPSILLASLSLLFSFYCLFTSTTSYPTSTITIRNYASQFHLLTQVLLWLTLALFTTILALKPPRHTPATSL
jgi:hypothetical protein